MQEFEAMGLTVDEAIKSVLEKQKLNRDDIEVTVIDSGSKGILGFNKRPAKILVRKNFDPQVFAEKFFNQVIEKIGLKVDVIIKLEDEILKIELVGQDAKFFIGRRGCILDSFEQIFGLSISKYCNIKVRVDAENYRSRQKEIIEHKAIRGARKVARSHVKFVFEPMNSYERLIIHKTLQTFPGVITYSEGEKQNRHVVVEWKDKK